MAHSTVSDSRFLGNSILDIKYPEKIKDALDLLNEANESIMQNDFMDAILAIGLAESLLMRSQWAFEMIKSKEAENH